MGDIMNISFTGLQYEINVNTYFHECYHTFYQHFSDQYLNFVNVISSIPTLDEKFFRLKSKNTTISYNSPRIPSEN